MVLGNYIHVKHNYLLLFKHDKHIPVENVKKTVVYTRVIGASHIENCKNYEKAAHCLSVNVLLSNSTVFLHLYLQFYYVSVAVVLPYSVYVARGTVYVVRIIFEVLP